MFGSLFSIWEAFFLLCGKGGHWLFPRVACGRGKQWQHRRLEGPVPLLQPKWNPLKSTGNSSWDMTIHSEESYLKWGCQTQPTWEWANLEEHCWLSRVQKNLFWASEAGGLCCLNVHVFLQRLVPGLFSFQHPSRVSVLLCAGHFWIVALDVQVLQLGSNDSTASLQSFWLLFVRKNRDTLILVSHSSQKHFTHWELGEQQLFRTCDTFYFPVNSAKQFSMWFKECTNLQCNYLKVCVN